MKINLRNRAEHLCNLSSLVLVLFPAENTQTEERLSKERVKAVLSCLYVIRISCRDIGFWFIREYQIHIVTLCISLKSVE